jgi:hypothetical protein
MRNSCIISFTMPYLLIYMNYQLLIDGRCDIGNNTPRCKFDGGDCLLWNEHYPDCNGDAHKFAGE